MFLLSGNIGSMMEAVTAWIPVESLYAQRCLLLLPVGVIFVLLAAAVIVVRSIALARWYDSQYYIVRKAVTSSCALVFC